MVVDFHGNFVHPPAEQIDAVDLRLSGDKIEDTCPEETHEDHIENSGPIEVRAEERDGATVVTIVSDAEIEGEYDPATGEWQGSGDAIFFDGSHRLRESLDGVWGFEDGEILFEGRFTFGHFDTRGTPDDFSDDAEICEASYDATFRER